jgi:hypothetical protein
MVKYRDLIIVPLYLILLTSGLFGQASISGKISGKVVDEEGNALPLVSVEATSPKLLGKAACTTDAAGNYHLLALPPGVYRISYALQDFKTVIRQDVRVHLDGSIGVDIVMPRGSPEEIALAAAPAPLIDVKSTTAGMTMANVMFGLLPRGRSFDSLVTVTPGMNAEPFFFGGGGLTVGGASSAENMYFIDGTDITTSDRGIRGQEAAFEFVDEVRVTAGGQPAESGGALGGVVSVITRQGGNEFHGELIGYYEGSALTGKERDVLRLNPWDFIRDDYFNYEDYYGKDETHRIEAGFSLGGYILKDKLWFFGSALPVYAQGIRRVDFLSTEVEDDLPYDRKDYAYNFQAKITAQPARFVRLGASFLNNFTKYRGELPPRDGTGSIKDLWEIYGYDYPNWSLSGFADLSFGNNISINLRGGRFFSNTANQQVQPTEPRWYLSGFGTQYFNDSALEIPAEYQRPRNWANRKSIDVIERNERARSHLAADLSHYLTLAGEHTLKFGVQWVRLEEDVFDALKYPIPDVRFYWGQPIYVAGINYGMGNYGSYSVAGNEVTGPSGICYGMHSDRWAVYLQDSWTIADSFTLNIGLRAESGYIPPYTTELPPGIPKGSKPVDFSFAEKLAPRIGFIYDVFGDAGLKVFGSYGLYHDVMETFFGVSSFGGLKQKIAYYTLHTYEWDKVGIDGNYPGELKLVYDWAGPAFETTDPNIKPMSQRNLSLGAEKRLGENLSLAVRFVQNHLRYAIEDIGVHLPGEGIVSFLANPGYGYSLWTTHGGKLDPAYPETPKAKREYTALTLSLDKRLADNWLAGFSYTWSRLTGNYSGLASSDEAGIVDPYLERDFNIWSLSYTKDLEPIDGPLPTDRPHYFKFYGAFTFPFRLTIGVIVNAMSGTPVTEAWQYQGAWHYPFNRGYVRAGESGDKLEKKRTPFLWFANLYAEYGLKLGRTSLQLNVNIDNVFDIATARLIFNRRNRFELEVPEEQLLSGNWDLDTGEWGYYSHPFWLKQDEFYPPISIRLGAKFIF